MEIQFVNFCVLAIRLFPYDSTLVVFMEGWKLNWCNSAF
jgi:hypothetical protein